MIRCSKENGRERWIDIKIRTDHDPLLLLFCTFFLEQTRWHDQLLIIRWFFDSYTSDCYAQEEINRITASILSSISFSVEHSGGNSCCRFVRNFLRCELSWIPKQTMRSALEKWEDTAPAAVFSTQLMIKCQAETASYDLKRLVKICRRFAWLKFSLLPENWCLQLVLMRSQLFTISHWVMNYSGLEMYN